MRSALNRPLLVQVKRLFFSSKTSMSTQASPVQIVILGPKSGDDALLKLAHLPTEARIVATGTSLSDIQEDGDEFAQVNRNLTIVVLFWLTTARSCHSFYRLLSS